MAALGESEAAPRVSGCLLRDPRKAALPPGVAICTTTGELIAARPALVVECAGHGAVAAHVPELLLARIDVVILSVGALCDDALRDRLDECAERGRSRWIPATGAVGGLDALRAARIAGLDEVVYRGIKPPQAWASSPAERLAALSGLSLPVTFFRGSARQAALLFPKNANVAASIALAGIGLDATRVELVADPAGSTNVHEIHARGAAGEFRISVHNRPLPSNPKTSYLAALSAQAAVQDYFRYRGMP